jgi:succinate dehydrogenase/fumarate reductase cytochrome b subunit
LKGDKKMANSQFQMKHERRTEAQVLKLKQRPFVGYVAWLVQRITALLLLILLPLKIYSGYAMAGKLPAFGMIKTLHLNAFLDAGLIFALIFHALYGFRVILIDVGLVKDNRGVFKLITIIGAVLCAITFYFLVS